MDNIFTFHSRSSTGANNKLGFILAAAVSGPVSVPAGSPALSGLTGTQERNLDIVNVTSDSRAFPTSQNICRGKGPSAFLSTVFGSRH